MFFQQLHSLYTFNEHWKARATLVGVGEPASLDPEMSGEAPSY